MTELMVFIMILGVAIALAMKYISDMFRGKASCCSQDCMNCPLRENRDEEFRGYSEERGKRTL